MKNWLRQHRFALTVALTHLRASPAGFAFNVLVVALALALPIAGLTLLENVRPISAQLAVEPEVSLFLSPALSADKARSLQGAIAQVLQQQGHKARISFISREQALSSLQGRGAVADVVSTLGQNPLPDSYVLHLDNFASAKAADQVDHLVDTLKKIPGVDSVQVDSAWVKRLAALLAIFRLGLLFLAATLSVVVLVVVFNTIRLQVMTQMPEIEIAKLIGATDSFIRRPFYYTGAILGALAAGLALALVAALLPPLNQAIAEFAHLYASEFQLRPLSPVASGLLFAFATLLALLGARLSVARHLARLR